MLLIVRYLMHAPTWRVLQPLLDQLGLEAVREEQREQNSDDPGPVAGDAEPEGELVPPIAEGREGQQVRDDAGLGRHGLLPC